MRGSLQEQLLNSGLVNKEQLEKASSERKNSNKPKSAKPKKGTKKGKTKSAKTRKPVVNKAEEKKALELDKNTRVEIKKLLRANKLNDRTGEVPYNYVIENQVKRFYLNQEQLERVKKGELVITNWNDRTYLIPFVAVAELHKLHPGLPISKSDDGGKVSDSQEKIADEYSDYVIPDDLTW